MFDTRKDGGAMIDTASASESCKPVQIFLFTA